MSRHPVPMAMAMMQPGAAGAEEESLGPTVRRLDARLQDQLLGQAQVIGALSAGRDLAPVGQKHRSIQLDPVGFRLENATTLLLRIH